MQVTCLPITFHIKHLRVLRVWAYSFSCTPTLRDRLSCLAKTVIFSLSVCVGANERQTSIAAGDDGNSDLLFAITSPTKDENGLYVSNSHTVSSVYPGWMERLCKCV